MKIKKIMFFICYNIEYVVLSILIIYLCIYSFCELNEEGIIFNYILILLLGIQIGCRITRAACKYLNKNSINIT